MNYYVRIALSILGAALVGLLIFHFTGKKENKRAKKKIDYREFVKTRIPDFTETQPISDISPDIPAHSQAQQSEYKQILAQLLSEHSKTDQTPKHDSPPKEDLSQTAKEKSFVSYYDENVYQGQPEKTTPLVLKPTHFNPESNSPVSNKPQTKDNKTQQDLANILQEESHEESKAETQQESETFHSENDPTKSATDSQWETSGDSQSWSDTYQSSNQQTTPQSTKSIRSHSPQQHTSPEQLARSPPKQHTSPEQLARSPPKQPVNSPIQATHFKQDQSSGDLGSQSQPISEEAKKKQPNAQETKNNFKAQNSERSSLYSIREMVAELNDEEVDDYLEQMGAVVTDGQDKRNFLVGKLKQ